MYKRIIRPMLFWFSPETMHHTTISVLRLLRRVPLAPQIMRGLYKTRDKGLERSVFGLRFRNPVGLAAGYDKNAECYDMLGNLGFGFLEIGTVTPRSQGGNPKPRCFRLPKDQAIINRMGFNNNGVDVAVKNLRRYKRRGIIIGGNIGKNTLTANENATRDYLRAFRSLYDYVDYFTVNISCPNVVNLTALQSKDGTAEIVRALKDFRKGQNAYRPILLKISPDLGPAQIDTMIEVALEHKIDGIVATNTTTSREGLVTTTAQAIGNGGLSGAPLRQKAIDTVAYIHKKTDGKLPIIGVGGIMTPQDATAMLEAGAALVQVYSGLIYNGPGLVKRICRTISGGNRSEK